MLSRAYAFPVNRFFCRIDSFTLGTLGILVPSSLYGVTVPIAYPEFSTKNQVKVEMLKIHTMNHYLPNIAQT